MRRKTFDRPHFIGIGGQKCGTTRLYKVLKEHPEIWLPLVKEIHYFDNQKLSVLRSYPEEGADPWYFFRRRYRKHFKARFSQVKKDIRHGNLRLRDLLWDLNYFLRLRGDGWYASLFPDKENVVAGEITPRLLHIG